MVTRPHSLSPGRRACLVVLFAFVAGLSAARAQTIRKMEFRNQPMADILMVLAQASGKSIIVDETVTGSTSFYFAESRFEDALALFLSSNRLYAESVGGAYRVSRISARYDAAADEVHLKAEEVDATLLVRALSRAIGRTIVLDQLPRVPLSAQIEGLPAAAALGVLLKRFPEYRVEDDGACFLVRRAPQDPRESAGRQASRAVARSGDFYSIALERGSFLECLEALFKEARVEYSLLTRADATLEDLYFRDKSFEQLLRLLLEQGSADYVVSEGVHYVFEIQRRDVLKKLKSTETVFLQHQSAQDAVALLPPDYASGGLVKVDRAANAVILSGSPEEIGPARAYLASIDRPLEGRRYRRFDLRYAKARDVVPLIPPRLLALPPVVLPEGNAFAAAVGADGGAAIEEYLGLVDRKAEGYLVELRYIRSDELMKNLPPSASKEDVVETGDPTRVFFVGSEAKRVLFLRDLALVDRPRPQLRYQLLVVQYQKSAGDAWTRSLEAAPSDKASSWALAGAMGNLLNLNFDVVSQFGYLFALKLNLELGANRARVFADTTLSGLSGQEVRFQNTDTFRYRETELDPATGKPLKTSTRELTSGLILGIGGWVSGDGMITMNVAATVSKRGAAGSAANGNPPTTSEKVISTQIRTPSGKPIVIGGLLQRERTVSEKKVPVLGDLPLLGLLFKNITESEENTEMVLYIVPHLCDDDPGASAQGRLGRYYDRFVRGYAR